MDADNPLWAYLADRAALEGIVADGERIHVSPPIFDHAVDAGDVALARLLFAAGDESLLSTFDELAWTPLMYAAKNGDVPMMAFLLEAGSDVNANDESRIGDTALALAVSKGHYDAAKFLVEHGARSDDSRLDGSHAVGSCS